MALFASSTRAVPETGAVPRHVAIIMDGNGRWARKRFMPRFSGHAKGVEVVRDVVRACLERGIGYLTLFAFSSENWRRPQEEVSLLMQLFVKALEQEIEKLDSNGVRLRIVGDLSRFDPRLRELIRAGERRTAHNQRLHLTIAANYGGRWDIMQAVNAMQRQHPERQADWAEPDLFIRTGGEQRISNFLLWQLAYTELYFTDALWPEFDSAEFARAIASYGSRERRFGRTGEQLEGQDA
jgi:undecaprenyl diphosphate synthase